MHVFSSLLDALLLWWKIVLMYEVSQPLSPKIVQSVCDRGAVTVHRPQSHAAVRILDGALFQATTVWVNACISTASYSWKMLPKRTLRDDLKFPEMRLPCCSMAVKFYFKNFSANLGFGILTCYCWGGTELSFLVLGGEEWCVCIRSVSCPWIGMPLSGDFSGLYSIPTMKQSIPPQTVT